MNKTILILGGRGFLGRHIAKSLTKLGAKVVIGTRQQLSNCNNYEYRSVQLHKAAKYGFESSLFENIDIVINTVGILRERLRESYNDVHHIAVKKLAEKCVKLNIPLIHISALGLQNPVQSRFLKSKRLGESALKDSNVNWTIVRPSLLDGDGGFGAKWFRRVAKWPIHFLPKSAIGKIAPIHVYDFGDVVANLCSFNIEKHKKCEIELGGEFEFGLSDYLQYLDNGKPKLVIKIPTWFARSIAHICDLFHITPFSFGHYELLKFDNIPKHNLSQQLLGRKLTALGKNNRPSNELLVEV